MRAHRAHRRPKVQLTLDGQAEYVDGMRCCGNCAAQVLIDEALGFEVPGYVGCAEQPKALLRGRWTSCQFAPSRWRPRDGA